MSDRRFSSPFEWDALTALYEEEEPSGTAPKLYRRMKELLAEAEACR